MNIMNLSNNNGLSVFFDQDIQPSKALLKHRENERRNLLLFTRLVLRRLLEYCMQKESGSGLLDEETWQLSDLLVMMEKVLWHGLRGQRSLLALRTPDGDLWAMLIRMGKRCKQMDETIRCVQQLSHLQSAICRVRAFFRLALMQKKLADYMQIIVESRDLLKQEDAVALAGAFLGLSVLDCVFVLREEQMGELPTSLDLSRYIKMPTVPREGTLPAESKDENTEDDIKTIMDQNRYLEERNKQLMCNLDNLKSKTTPPPSTNGLLQHSPSPVDQAKTNEHVETLTTTVGRLEKTVSEKQDVIIGLLQQIEDVKKINTDLYQKLRITEDTCKRQEKEMIKLREQHHNEREQERKTMDILRAQYEQASVELTKRNDCEEMLRKELTTKTDLYSETTLRLEQKQNEFHSLRQAQEKLLATSKEQTDRLKSLSCVEQDMADLTVKYDYTNRRMQEYEKALEELGIHLSESKLKMEDMKEELLPLSDAQWMRDKEVDKCKACRMQFSVSRRKHHCRNCGGIFCDPCSQQRVALPSNANPVRVCDGCSQLLAARNSSRSNE